MHNAEHRDLRNQEIEPPSKTLATVQITSATINDVTNNLPAERAAKIRGILNSTMDGRGKQP